MLLAASFALLGLFRLAKSVANTEVAIATTILTALYPVFFAQSSLVHLDVAAAGFTFWGLYSYAKGKGWKTAIWFSLASLTKETAILAPLALFAWDVVSPLLPIGKNGAPGGRRGKPVWLLVPIFPLAAWYFFHYWKTGFVFGNPEFFRYNVQATIHPLRVARGLAGPHLANRWLFQPAAAASGGGGRHVAASAARSPGRTPTDRSLHTVRHVIGDGDVCSRHGIGRRSGAGALYVAGGAAGDSGLRFHALAQSAPVALRSGDPGADVRVGCAINPPYGFAPRR